MKRILSWLIAGDGPVGRRIAVGVILLLVVLMAAAGILDADAVGRLVAALLGS